MCLSIFAFHQAESGRFKGINRTVLKLDGHFHQWDVKDDGWWSFVPEGRDFCHFDPPFFALWTVHFLFSIPSTSTDCPFFRIVQFESSTSRREAVYDSSHRVYGQTVHFDQRTSILDFTNSQEIAPLHIKLIVNIDINYFVSYYWSNNLSK